MTIRTVKYSEIKDDKAFWAGLPADMMWGAEGDERLHAVTLEEILEEILDDRIDMEPPPTEYATITAYVRMSVTVDAKDSLEWTLDQLDENYGDPEGDPFEATPAMLEAAAAFAAVIEREYKPWACEPFVNIIYNVDEGRAALAE